MKIALFSDTFIPQVNGVAHSVERLAHSLARAGHAVRIFAPTQKAAHSLKQEPAYTLTILPSLPALVYGTERFALPFFLPTKDLLDFAPDIIHTHTPLCAGWEALRAARQLNIPLIGTHHTFYDHYLRHVHLDYPWAHAYSWKATVWYYNHCKVVISPTRSLAEALIGNKLHVPVEIVPNTVETGVFTPATQAEKTGLRQSFGITTGSVVLYLGRLSYEKSVDQVLRAFASVHAKRPDTTLLIVGDGPERKTLQELAESMQVRSKVIFTGFLHGTELAKALQSSDLYVSASKSENMPLSTLEAMAAGLPIVAVGSLGMNEILKDGVHACVLPPDHPDSMAEKIGELLDDPKMLQSFSQASRARALAYSPEIATGRILELYERACAESSR